MYHIPVYHVVFSEPTNGNRLSGRNFPAHTEDAARASWATNHPGTLYIRIERVK